MLRPVRLFAPFLVGSLLWLSFCPAPAVADDETDRRPNVIIFYTDDQGSLDANCYGSDDLITPTMDRLAATGVRFTQMYAPSAICSASRAGLMTGRFPARAGVPGNVSSTKGQAGMPTTEVTIAELLGQSGYATGHIGKWHLGYTPETMPNGQGYDFSIGHMGGCIDNYSHFFYWQGPNRHDLWMNGTEIFRDGEYFGDLMVDHCKEFISENREEPFFAYMAINWPHYPLQGTAKWREAYADRDLEHPRDKYAVFVSTLDETMGQIVDHVESLGLRERTLILFQSDHGHSVEERAFFGGGNPGPYRGAKGCLFEGGLRVPSIISMPGTIPQGEVRDQPVFGCDWLPTIADYAGVATDSLELDGESIRSVIESADAASPHGSLYWQLGRGKNAQWAVRKADWKLLGNPQDRRDPDSLKEEGPLFLANLAEDIGESNNVAKTNPEIVAELQAIRDANVAGIETDQ